MEVRIWSYTHDNIDETDEPLTLFQKKSMTELRGAQEGEHEQNKQER